MCWTQARASRPRPHGLGWPHGLEWLRGRCLCPWPDWRGRQLRDLLSQSVVDGKPVQLSDQFLGAGVEFLQRGIFDLVDALDLTYQQLGVADDFEGFVSVLDRILERGDQALVFGEIIGLMAEVLAERSNFFSSLILNYHTVARRARIPASSAVAVCDQILLGRLGVWRRK